MARKVPVKKIIWGIRDVSLKILNDTKLIPDRVNPSDSFRIYFESFKSFISSLFPKPVTSQELFFSTWYNKSALIARMGGNFSNDKKKLL